MTWLTVKKWWAKASVWCRQHWRWLVMFAIAMVAYCFGRKNARALLIQSKLALKQSQKEIEAIENAHQKEIQLREKAKKDYDQSMIDVQNELLRKMDNLDEKKQRELKSMLKKAEANPAEFDRILEQELGIKKT